jgi:hypothetical protein
MPGRTATAKVMIIARRAANHFEALATGEARMALDLARWQFVIGTGAGGGTLGDRILERLG